jgi:hypothetical protein
MSRRVWQAVHELARVWRTSDRIQQYGRVAPKWRSESEYGSADHIEAQPFLLCEYIHTRVSLSRFRPEPDSPPWLDDGAKLALSYCILVEFLRSRCAGYPFTEAPQLSRNSPWVNFNVSMNIPWLPYLRDMQIQRRRTAPVFPELGIEIDRQYPYTTQLMHAFIDSEPVACLIEARKAMSESDIAQLMNARISLDDSSFQARRGHTSGNEDFRYAAWAEARLDATLRLLDGPARKFSEALNRLDSFVQQIGSLLSHLVFYNKIRILENVTLVEQMNGKGGWHTVRIGGVIRTSIRQLEVVGFDHPYPKELMVVHGLTERLAFRGHGSLTLYGLLLPDSASLELPTITPGLL